MTQSDFDLAWKLSSFSDNRDKLGLKAVLVDGMTFREAMLKFGHYSGFQERCRCVYMELFGSRG